MAARQDGDPEQPHEEDDHEEVPPPTWIFPLEPFKYCPPPAKVLIPGTWQKIQDGTHLTLIAGVASCLGLIVQAIAKLVNFHCAETFCPREVFVILFILPFSLYCVKIIAQYDDRLVSKQKNAKDQRKKLTQAYNELISDMDGLLTKSAESSAGLAERSFESKRRDFQRFLERVKQRYSSVYSSSKSDYEKLITEFRRFCLNWLRVFEECSIDPTACPKRVVTEEELTNCSSIVEIADLCLERLRVTEVRFISMQREQDQKMISTNKTTFHRMTNAKLPKGAKKLALMSGRQVELAMKRRVMISWIQCGRGLGCRCQCRNNDNPEGFPKTFSCVCMSLTILSKEHLLLLSTFLFGWVFVALDIWQLNSDHTPSNMGGLTMNLISQFCLLVMLLRFEQIDVLQQLEREVKKLTQQNEAVEGQSTRMKDFWSNCQQLTELWLYRTVPRLDLYKEIHSQLEDQPPEDLLVNIQGVNDKLENLERNLGALEMWRKDGELKTDAKKDFGRKMAQLCQEEEFSDMLTSLEDITANGTGGLKALGPAQALGPSSNNLR